jgi:enediyne biosynthesis protein E4
LLNVWVPAFAGMTALISSAFAEEFTYPNFSDDTKRSGINSVFKGDWQYMVGGGVAAFDCNGDGYLDAYIAGGENPAKLFVNRSRKSGALRFTQKKSITALTAVTGAYALDVDSDGRQDLVVLRVGESKVFKGLGNCRFADMGKQWTMDGGNAWATAFAATWEASNTWPTFAFGTYIDRAFEDDPWGHCSDNWLLRPNDKQSGFGPRIALKPSFCALSMLFTDWNRSGTPSLRVANDREYYIAGQEQLWKLTVNQPPTLYTAEDGWRPQRFWGMGIAGADLNGDGFSEYMITSMADQRLQFLADGAAKPNYRDAVFSVGSTAHRPFVGGDTRPSTGWHTQFEDVNNDGRYDLFIAKGNVDRMPDFAEKDPSNFLLQDDKGNFVEGAEKAGMLNFGLGRGAVVADFNMDGKLDVMIVNRRENVRLFRNAADRLGNWIGVKLEQKTSNRNGIGAWIEVKRGDSLQSREVTVGGGHVSGVNGFWHFGLAQDADAELRVIWPGGKTSEWTTLSANAHYVVGDDGSVHAWTSPR